MSETLYKLNKTTGEYEEVAPKIVPGLPQVSDGYGQGLTREDIEKHLPKKYGGTVTDAVLDEINSIEESTGLPQGFMEEEILSNMYQLEGSGTTLRGLVNALKYCNLREHMTNEKAWSIVFKKESDRLESEGRFKASHVSMYNKSDMVVKVMKSQLVASNIKHQPLREAAIRIQANLMNGIGAKDDDRVSPTVQQIASAKIIDMTELDPDNSIELKMGLSDSALEAQNNLAEGLRASALAMQQQLASGKSLEDVQKIGITYEAEVIDD